MTLRIRNSQGGCRSGRGLGYFFIPLGFDRNRNVIPLGFIKKAQFIPLGFDEMSYICTWVSIKRREIYVHTAKY